METTNAFPATSVKHARAGWSASSARVRIVRAGAVWGMTGSGVTMAYIASTLGRPHRPAMAAIAGSLIVMCLLMLWRGASSDRPWTRAPVALGATVLFIGGSAALSALDGGVASPVGALLPFSVIFAALATPPGAFAALWAVVTVAFWCAAVLGGPGPPGYAFVCWVGSSVVSFLCLRHAGALVSLRRRLAQVSRLDPLTGVLNRRGLDERLLAELAEAQRTGDPITLVRVDLDGFKEVNDTHGHQAGDRLLAWTAERLAEDLRSHDAVGRVGGDEFIVVLGDTGPDGADQAVRRLRSSLDGVAPASFGHASFPADGTTAEELSHVADMRLYQEKQSARRRSPPTEAVAMAEEAMWRSAASAETSHGEQRYLAVQHAGLIEMCAGGAAVLYALLYLGGRQDQVAMFLLASVVGILGMVTALAAGPLSRNQAGYVAMDLNGLIVVLLAVPMMVIDGGVTTACGLGVLLPMPLIALIYPARKAIRNLAVFLSSYVVVAVVVGASSAWYVAMYLGVTVAASLVCGLQSRTAAERRRLLTRLSRTDALTDVLNRRGFEERFEAELAHAQRTGEALSLVLLDLDGFKEVNDRRGHAAGDDLLRWVAGTLTTALHPHDTVGRVGGDEFTVLLTSRSAAETPAVVERLLTALAERTEVSAGTALLGRDGDSLDALFAHADAQLYLHKSCRRRDSADAGASGDIETGRLGRTTP